MKASITLDNKARFFALYWIQQVLRIPTEDRISYTLQHPYLSGTFMTKEKGYYLLLKPLSAISDEDAKEVGISVDDVLQYKDYLPPLSPKDFDYLRLKGYALPWAGLTVSEMIEAGWIKLRN